jgi:hypothetical protein
MTTPYMISGNHSDGGWIVIGPSGFVKHEANLGVALDLCKSMNAQHSNIVRLADAHAGRQVIRHYRGSDE